MSVYNNEATVSDSIASIVAQTYADWELLLVDDKSATAVFIYSPIGRGATAASA